MEQYTVKINGIEVTAPKGTTILEAARMAGVTIPTLCYLKDINAIGACRICVVEVKGARGLCAACVYPIAPNMEVFTHTPRVVAYRKKTLELILSDHNCSCLSCVRSGDCELQALCREYGVDQDAYAGAKNPPEFDDSAVHMVRDNSKCILCRRCVAACEKNQGIGVIGANERGFKTKIGCAFEMDLADTSCVSCGQCIAVCPVGALYEKSCIDEVTAAINDPDKYVVVQTAPAVRAALAEAFGKPIGTNAQGKMAAALRRLGFDKVFDTNFGADLTIMEEANEFIERVQNGGKLPLITSCSPGWVKFCEHYYPEFTENLSSCKSPQQMQGAITKSYFAEKMGIDPAKIVSVSVMPCTATRMIKRAGIRWDDLPEEEFDHPLGEGTGAAVIFGATGGVMEAALRTAVERLTGETLGRPEFVDVRGVEGIKEASYNVAGLQVNICVASGLANAAKVLDMVKSGEKNYHFIEIMACPGGCVNGGGQPQVHASVRNFVDIRAERAKVLYSLDEANTIRKSHENPEIIELYDKFLGKPGSHKAHELLHTSYIKRVVHKKF